MRYIVKHILCVCCFCLSYVISEGQILIGRIYVTVSDQIVVYGLDQTRNKVDALSFTVRKGAKFSVVGFDASNNVLISFWRYGPRKKREEITRTGYFHYPKDTIFVSDWADYKIFAISPTVLTSSCKEYFGTKHETTWGVMTLPIKVRFGNSKDKMFDFEERLNLGFVAGWRTQLKGYSKQSVNYLAGFGITSAQTDSSSLKDLKYYDGKTSLALSVHLGTLYQLENFQIGLFIGTDFIPGRVGREWKYQGKPWLGLAMGISLFSKNSGQEGAENGTNNK